MMFTVELDDGTALGASTPEAVRAALHAHADTERVTVNLAHNDGPELIVGYREERGVCYFVPGEADEPLVSAGGTNTDTEVYGNAQIAFPPGAELDADTVTEAAVEFAASGSRPTCVQWRPYNPSAFPRTDGGITIDELHDLLNQNPSQV